MIFIGRSPRFCTRKPLMHEPFGTFYVCVWRALPNRARRESSDSTNSSEQMEAAQKTH